MRWIRKGWGRGGQKRVLRMIEVGRACEVYIEYKTFVKTSVVIDRVPWVCLLARSYGYL